jgi:hypothetical protein
MGTRVPDVVPGIVGDRFARPCSDAVTKETSAGDRKALTIPTIAWLIEKVDPAAEKS